MSVALISAYHKSDRLAAFAGALQKLGWTILASAGTKKFLDEKGVVSQDVAAIVGSPILGHRVVTLSREIHAGLLSTPEDAAVMQTLGLRQIDLVYVDLYPLEEEIQKAGASEGSVIEKTDIGGPTMLRAAAKGRRIVLSSEAQFDEALRFIESGKPDARYLRRLAAEAEETAARYATASAAYLRSLA